MNEFEIGEESSLKVMDISPPPSTITFYTENEAVGTLDLKAMTFEGDADEAAQIFFNHILRIYENALTEAEQTIKKISDTVTFPFDSPEHKIEMIKIITGVKESE